MVWVQPDIWIFESFPSSSNRQQNWRTTVNSDSGQNRMWFACVANNSRLVPAGTKLADELLKPLVRDTVWETRQCFEITLAETMQRKRRACELVLSWAVGYISQRPCLSQGVYKFIPDTKGKQGVLVLWIPLWTQESSIFMLFKVKIYPS